MNRHPSCTKLRISRTMRTPGKIVFLVTAALSACGKPARVTSTAGSEAPAIVPRPTSVEPKEGSFRFGRDTVLVATGAAAEPAQVFAEQLAPAIGATLPVRAT